MDALNSYSQSRSVPARVAARAGGALAVAGIVALVAGCGSSPSSGVARLGGEGSSSGHPAAAASGPKSALAFAECMRSHGLPGFPDPGSDNRFSIGTGVDPGSSQFSAAQKACRSLLPTGGTSLTTQGSGGNLSQDKQAQLLRLARCMRSHGVPNFPDPTSQGIALSPGIDPKSPQFQAATQACNKLAPAFGRSGAQTVTPGPGGGS
jgi:hypothetical protein